MKHCDLINNTQGSVQLALSIYGDRGCQETALSLFPDYRDVELKILAQLDELMVQNDLTPKQFIGVLDKYKQEIVDIVEDIG